MPAPFLLAALIYLLMDRPPRETEALRSRVADLERQLQATRTVLEQSEV